MHGKIAPAFRRLAVVTALGLLVGACDWVTIESAPSEPLTTSTPTPTAVPSDGEEVNDLTGDFVQPLAPTTTDSPSPSDFVPDERWPPGSRWTVTDVPRNLNVRAGPNTSHQVIGTAPLDATVTLTGRFADSPASGLWLQITYEELVGWVYSIYLTPG